MSSTASNSTDIILTIIVLDIMYSLGVIVVAMQTVKLPAKRRAQHFVYMRLDDDEYNLIAAKAAAARVKISTLARIVLVQVLKAGIEVS